MTTNVWNDYLAGTDELDVEEIMNRLQELYRAVSGQPTWGRPMLLTQYDGPEFVVDGQNAETVDSHLLRLKNHDASVMAQGDNTGWSFTGPWTFTGNGLITGTAHITGAVTLDSTLHTLGAVDFDTTLNVDGAVTFQTTLHGIGAVTFDGAGTLGDAAADVWTFKGTNTFNEDSTFKKAVSIEGNTILGNAAGDTITGTGTATFAEDFTLSKRLIVAGNIVNDTLTFVTDSVNNKVGVGVVPISTDAMFNVAGRIRSTELTGAPTTGTGLEMFYWSGGATAFIIAVDRATTTYKPIDMVGSLIDIRPNDTSKLQVDATGIGAFGHATAAQATAPAVVAGTADATYSANEVTLINDLVTAVNQLRTVVRAHGFAA